MTIELTWLNVVIALAVIIYVGGLWVFRGLGAKAAIWPVVWAAMALFWRP